MPRLADLALPIALVLLQFLWSGIFQQLPWASEAPDSPNELENAGVSTPEPQPVPNPKKVAVVNAVRWLPDEGSFSGEETEVPLFPLPSFYSLHSRPTLKIFEPRYRQLYEDLLVNSKREFAVTALSETGQLAAFAVIFRIDELKDVAKETNSQVKYLAKHTVMRRVQISRVVQESSYMKAMVIPVEDDPGDGDSEKELETDTVESFKDLISL